MPVNPTREQLEALASGPQEPVVMIHLLKFAETAAGSASTTGEAAYARYGVRVQPLLRKMGARVLWHGRGDQVVIGSEADAWDAVVLVAYPSRQAYLAMINSPEYREVAKDREAALVDARLIVTTELPRAV